LSEVGFWDGSSLLGTDKEVSKILEVHVRSCVKKIVITFIEVLLWRKRIEWELDETSERLTQIYVENNW